VAAEQIYLLSGTALLLAVVLPALLHRFAISPALVLLAVGALLGLTPLVDGLGLDVADLEGDRVVIEHVTELTVLTALMGVGLAIDRPLDLRRAASWRRWSATWRLLAVAMPLCVAGVALLGWAALGLGPAAALLLGAALSPTDPVLASDVQVGGPGSSIADDAPDGEDPTTVTESGEVRFALTSEAGLNDGLAFPFVHLALLVAAGGPLLGGAVEWVGVYLVGEIVIGVVVGLVVGRGLGMLAFRARARSLRLAEQGEPLLALAALLATYGAAELLQGYGFIAVFVCGMALRSAEHRHDYHRDMHQVISRLERLLTLLVLLVLGVSLSTGLLAALDWRGVLVAVALTFVVRPLAAWVSLAVAPREEPHAGGLNRRSRHAVAFFGVRGVGSLFYLAWATGEPEAAGLGGPDVIAWLWATVAFTIALSVVVHGVASTPVMQRLAEEPTAAGHPA